MTRSTPTSRPTVEVKLFYLEDKRAIGGTRLQSNTHRHHSLSTFDLRSRIVGHHPSGRSRNRIISSHCPMTDYCGAVFFKLFSKGCMNMVTHCIENPSLTSHQPHTGMHEVLSENVVGGTTTQYTTGNNTTPESPLFASHLISS